MSQLSHIPHFRLARHLARIDSSLFEHLGEGPTDHALSGQCNRGAVWVRKRADCRCCCRPGLKRSWRCAGWALCFRTTFLRLPRNTTAVPKVVAMLAQGPGRAQADAMPIFVLDRPLGHPADPAAAFLDLDHLGLVEIGCRALQTSLQAPANGQRIVPIRNVIPAVRASANVGRLRPAASPVPRDSPLGGLNFGRRRRTPAARAYTAHCRSAAWRRCC